MYTIHFKFQLIYLFIWTTYVSSVQIKSKQLEDQKPKEYILFAYNDSTMYQLDNYMFAFVDVFLFVITQFIRFYFLIITEMIIITFCIFVTG